MRYSQYLLPTLKEIPSEAEVPSHQLMLRAGMIRKLAAGIYSYLPLGLRAIRKVEGIIREEMNRAGAIEVLLPFVQPSELWQESGTVGRVRKGTGTVERPAQPGLLPRPDPRGSHYGYCPQGDTLLPADARQSLPDPDEVQG